MDINDMTLGEIKNIAATMGGQAPLDNGMNGQYVLVRCRDAGVHCGVLEAHSGRECVLLEARRLWYWKPANGHKFLSGVAIHGLDSSSKVGVPIPRMHLTENCEIMQMSRDAEITCREIDSDDQ